MKNFKNLLLIIVIVLTISCNNNKNVPDVSSIKVDVNIKRFEQDFFKIDTNKIGNSLNEINKKYPSFLPDYLYKILGLTPPEDTVIAQTKLFLKDSIYNNIYALAEKKFNNFNDTKKELTLALKLVKYYFPKYQPPTNVYTFIGPLDGVGTAITSDHSFAVGLQGYLGKDYPAYQLGYIVQTYPSYKSRRFEPQYISTNCIKNVIEEIFPNPSNGRPLVERIIEEGKRMYLLDALLPYTADTIKTGYTQSQLDQCYKNEKNIWAFFIQGNLLFEREPSLINPYVTDGPKTQELSETSPGNIGQFTGWQIVKAYMKSHQKLSMQELMQTPTMNIFNEVSYNP